MTSNSLLKYLLNCFLLTVPIMIWNLLLSEKLPAAFQPEVFWNDIPPLVTYGENASRIFLFMFTLLMPLRVSTPVQKRGLFLYVAGTVLYFVSWLLLIWFPDSSWSQSMAGFTAPAYTPLIWLVGIGLVADSFYFNRKYKPWYFISIAVLFLLFHNFHTITVFLRLH